MSNCVIKNLASEGVFSAYGNSGKQFPHLECEIPEEPLCALVLQENSLVNVLTESGQPILMFCPG